MTKEQKKAHRKLRHKLVNEQTAEFRRDMPGISPKGISPKMAHFYARTKVDVMLSEGSTDADAHGRGLVRT